MNEIKHLLLQDNVDETFALIVEDSIHAGEYPIDKPDNFDDIDCIIDINDDYFNIDNLILGETEKVTFLQYSNGDAYDIIKKVYDEKGSDGKVIFSWKANGTEILGSGYEINFNKYSHSIEKSMGKIETEIKKREVQNKFLTREDVTVNLFVEKDLDDSAIPALTLTDAYYKEGVRKKGNFYY